MGILYFLLIGFLVLFGLHLAAAKWQTPKELPTEQPKGKKTMIVNDYKQFADNQNPVPTQKPIPRAKPAPNGYYYTKRRGKRKAQSSLSHRRKR